MSPFAPRPRPLAALAVATAAAALVPAACAPIDSGAPAASVVAATDDGGDDATPTPSPLPDASTPPCAADGAAPCCDGGCGGTGSRGALASIATSAGDAHDLAVGAAGDVFWTVWNVAFGGGHVGKVLRTSLAAGTGAPTTVEIASQSDNPRGIAPFGADQVAASIGDALDLFDGAEAALLTRASATTGTAAAVAVDGDTIYFTVQSGNYVRSCRPGNVDGCPAGGSLASTADGTGHLVARGGHVVWTESSTRIVRVGGDPLAPVLLATDANGIDAMTSDGTTITWANAARQLLRCPISDACVGTPLATLSARAAVLETDGTYLYYATNDDPGIWRAGLDGAAPTRLYVPQGQVTAIALANAKANANGADHAPLYWLTELADHAVLWSAPNP